MEQPLPALAFLLAAGRLLLEHNESSAAIEHVLEATAPSLFASPCHVVVTYRQVTLFVKGRPHASTPIHELRFNMAVVAQVYTTLRALRAGSLSLEAAQEALAQSQDLPLPHSRWLAATGFGLGAAALARLLGADGLATLVAGTAASLGLGLRQWMARRGFSLLTLPLAAAFLGAVLGGMAIRLGLIVTAELVLVVPALMLVPGAHLLNGLLDLFDNRVPMALARLGLALALLLAAALGVAVGMELTVADVPRVEPALTTPNLAVCALLAAVAACGFAFSYNCLWPQIIMVAAAAIVGNGIRLAALAADLRPEAATFLGAGAIGLLAAWMSRATRTPVAVIAFAAAVTMMPGLTMYRALSGVWSLARLSQNSAPPTVAATLSHTAEAGLVIGALAAGLIVGVRLAQTLLGKTTRQPSSE